MKIQELIAATESFVQARRRLDCAKQEFEQAARRLTTLQEAESEYGVGPKLTRRFVKFQGTLYLLTWRSETAGTRAMVDVEAVRVEELKS